MRASVIVTVCAGEGGYTYDIEVPTDIECRKVLADVMDALSAMGADISELKNARKMYSIRLQRFLDEHESFGSSGIWNGDVITIR